MPKSTIPKCPKNCWLIGLDISVRCLIKVFTFTAILYYFYIYSSSFHSCLLCAYQYIYFIEWKQMAFNSQLLFLTRFHFKLFGYTKVLFNFIFIRTVRGGSPEQGRLHCYNVGSSYCGREPWGHGGGSAAIENGQNQCSSQPGTHSKTAQYPVLQKHTILLLNICYIRQLHS